ncbi:hypothetical protein Z045_25180 [Rhodococcus pyridinivorans KG-16]|uniref:Uncharacterized protein n=1 Tax=Rhodococcus pyridinivorans KG-16 TaxID=1441730 RepID=A0A0V9UDD3_9NOCA|nr:hypothetical protein [Rhodococcus pyridinivorans]KSZ56088.1 hypothetical protein Z045_25180 [Rhodococcus pyridinivorans KG-16]
MKTGTRALSTVCDTEVMIIRAAEVELFCGGAPMVTARDGQAGAPEAGLDGGTLLGKRYTHAPSGLEVLCVKPGAGTLSVNGEPLTEVAAKQLPSSD